MEQDKRLLNDPFVQGYWREWLRRFAMDEQQQKFVEPKQLNSIRATISNMVGEDLYFKTEVSKGEHMVLTIKRIGTEEWLSQSKRRL